MSTTWVLCKLASRKCSFRRLCQSGLQWATQRLITVSYQSSSSDIFSQCEQSSLNHCHRHCHVCLSSRQVQTVADRQLSSKLFGSSSLCKSSRLLESSKPSKYLRPCFHTSSSAFDDCISKRTYSAWCEHSHLRQCCRGKPSVCSSGSFHTSESLTRKRKNKTSNDTGDGERKMKVAADSYKKGPHEYAEGQGKYEDEAHEYGDEAHEYADEAYEYADVLVSRGYSILDGHRVLVIQPTLKGQARQHHSSDTAIMLAEACSLVQTLQNWTVLDTLETAIKFPGKKYMFGQGTFQELTAQIRSQPDVTAVFLNVDRLTGIQKKTLEDEWGVPVLDRFEVVLQIFKEHASSREAKLQIALAEIQLRRSHLTHETIDLDQQGGSQHFIGGSGETLLERRQRILRDREGALRKALGKLKRKRELLRQGRQKKHFPHIAVVGYTNAGKTSLIKALTGDTKLHPRDQLFATLDVTAHLGYLSSRLPVIYLDTVGFISDLPHQLVASFAATLEDVLCADLIVHVRDSSHPDSVAQRFNVLSVLRDLGVPQKLMDGMVEVNNKTDLLQSRSEFGQGESSLHVSATEGTGLNQLKEVIESRLLEVTDRLVCEVRIPQSGSHLSWLYKEATVQDISTFEDDTEHLLVEVLFTKSAYSRFCAKFGDLRHTSL